MNNEAFDCVIIFELVYSLYTFRSSLRAIEILYLAHRCSRWNWTATLREINYTDEIECRGRKEREVE